MRDRRRQLAVLGALALVLAGIGVAALSGGGHAPGPRTVSPSPPFPPAPAEGFGANTGRLFNDGTYGQDQIDAQLRALHDTGATVARSDAPWETTEPNAPSGDAHHYVWTFDDTIAGDLAAEGLTWLPIIDYSTPWARAVAGQDHSAPEAAPYAAYAAAVAARYGPAGTFWQAHPQLPKRPVGTIEIWNEPDNPAFWAPRPDPSAYADLYTRARQAIDALQPRVRVIVGGLTHPANFLPALLAAAPGLRNQLDGVAIHPYGATPQAVLGNVRTARAELGSLGLGSLPLYVTEFGWTTSPPGALDYLSERLRPSYIQQTLTQLAHANCGLEAVVLYAWVTPGRDPANAQDWFGVHPPGGGSSPDTDAFAEGLRAVSAPSATSQTCAG